MAENISEIRLKCTVEKHGPPQFLPDIDPILRMVRYRVEDGLINMTTTDDEIVITRRFINFGLEKALGLKLLGNIFCHELFEGADEMEIN